MNKPYIDPLFKQVAIAAGCNDFYTWSAAIVGSVAGLVYMSLTWVVIRLRIDDPLDVVSVHAGGGLWGVISVAFFAKTDGIFIHCNMRSLMVWVDLKNIDFFC